MKNKEKFAKEIIEIAATGTSIAMCNGVLRECRGLYCSQCDFYSDRECDEKIKEWAESEYIEPKYETDWSKVPVDTALNWTPPPQSLVVASFNGIHICALCESFLTSSFYQVIFLFLPRSKPLLQG